jgi:hypothetical protein
MSSCVPHLLCDIFQMSDHKIIALGVVQSWEAPGILEGDEVRFLWVVVEVYGTEAPDLFSSHLRTVDALLERRWKYYRAVSLVHTATWIAVTDRLSI